MKNYKTRGGPFSERPYYENDEIDHICIDELQAVGLYPKSPEAIRIDRFIEKRFKVTPTYEDLGPGILGLTKFDKNGVKEVIISRTLDEENSVASDRRIRTTLAHEAGHGLLHTHLFVLTGQSELFPDGRSLEPKVLCRDECEPTADKRYKGQWWEYQANRAIGGLLLPRPLVIMALEDFLVPQGLLGLKTFDAERKDDAVRHLADAFDVNPVVASIRLDELFPAEQWRQQML